MGCPAAHEKLASGAFQDGDAGPRIASGHPWPLSLPMPAPLVPVSLLVLRAAWPWRAALLAVCAALAAGVTVAIRLGLEEAVARASPRGGRVEVPLQNVDTGLRDRAGGRPSEHVAQAEVPADLLVVAAVAALHREAARRGLRIEQATSVTRAPSSEAFGRVELRVSMVGTYAPTKAALEAAVRGLTVPAMQRLQIRVAGGGAAETAWDVEYWWPTQPSAIR